MDLKDFRGITLTNLSQINVVLGKNGCGKSFLLKELEAALGGREAIGVFRYISPERGGALKYEAGIEQALTEDSNWMRENRRNNQSSNFRQQSTILFRRLELLILREIEKEHLLPDYKPISFEKTIEQLNTLLDRVRLERDQTKVFRIVHRTINDETPTNSLSSGEAELISLGIEFLAFAKEATPEKENFLLVDEPDAHLHPDLQSRLAKFILTIFKDKPIKVILATHSTALLAALATGENTHVSFMRSGEHALHFRKVSEVDKAILPIFGAHPLSNVFNDIPPLFVEGEDDQRVWQQAVRSSNGALKLYPCPVDSVDRLSEYETQVNRILASVYDDARAFSLRDRDIQPEFIDDIDHVVRMRLSCRSAENLMLSDDVLESLGQDWTSFQMMLGTWANANKSHQYYTDVQAFITAGCPRKSHDLKSIRNILIGLMTNKPWEIVTGQVIGRLAKSQSVHGGDGSLQDFLGEKVTQNLLRISENPHSN